MVYNFTWWFGGLAAGGLLWGSLCEGQSAAALWESFFEGQSAAVLWESFFEGQSAAALWESLFEGQPAAVLWHLSVFMALQLGLFCHMYGRADCYAFCVCAIAEASLGMVLFDYLVLMLLAILLLFPVQLWRRNIARNGNLKQPVAFLPYIVTAFALHISVQMACGKLLLW